MFDRAGILLGSLALVVAVVGGVVVVLAGDVIVVVVVVWTQTIGAVFGIVADLPIFGWEGRRKKMVDTKSML